MSNIKVLKGKAAAAKAPRGKENPIAKLLKRKVRREAEEEPSRAARPAVPTYGPPMDLGKFGRVRAVPGQRATSVELRPGMYLVTFVPEKAVEMGFLPLLVPAIVNTAKKVLAPAPAAQPGAQLMAQPAPPPTPAPPAVPAFRLPSIAGEIAWMDEEGSEDLGCDGRPCRCGRR